MARLTKEQIVEKINAIEEKKERFGQRYAKKLAKLESDFQKELKKVPYEMKITPLVASITGKLTKVIDEAEARRLYEIELGWAKSEYDESMEKADRDIKHLKRDYDEICVKEANSASWKEMRTPIDSLVAEVKRVVDCWVESEKKAIQRDANEIPYYSMMSESQLLDWVVIPIAEEITYRCYTKIGKIASFTKLSFIYGKVDIVCFNEKRESCSLWATSVKGHYRTSVNGKGFFIRPHVRCFTK